MPGGDRYLCHRGNHKLATKVGWQVQHWTGRYLRCWPEVDCYIPEVGETDFGSQRSAGGAVSSGFITACRWTDLYTFEGLVVDYKTC